MNKSPHLPDFPSTDAECQKCARLLGTYVDGELDAPTLLEVEAHVARCEACRERIELDRAMRGTLRKVVREGSGADDAQKNAMRARMLAAMTAEAARGEARERGETVGLTPQAGAVGAQLNLGPQAGGAGSSGNVLGWRTLVPLSSAAALAIVWGSMAHAPGSATVGSANDGHGGLVRALASDPLAGFVEMHSRPWPMERTDPQSVGAFEQYVGVPVRPATFEKTGAHLVGGRLMPVNDERAALLEYRIGQGPAARRVSVFIYDPRKIQVSGEALQARAVGTAQVRVARMNGYSVALTQRNGIGYALASDLDQEHSAELAALADSD